MATDLADYSQAVNVVGGSVAITGTATVVISGTVPVSIAGTPTVLISGTVPVTITSGTVTINNANIAVINAAGTKTYDIAVPVGATLGITPLVVEFVRPIPASGLNTAIAINVPSFGAGNTLVAATIHGFQRTLGATAANSAQTASGPGGLNYLLMKSGVFMRVISGSVAGAIWVKR